jgi:hypothetical protein
MMPEFVLTSGTNPCFDARIVNGARSFRCSIMKNPLSRVTSRLPLPSPSMISTVAPPSPGTFTCPET